MNRVPVVFCFDDNYSSQAAVAIASLLEAKNSSTNYVIYCVVPSDFRISSKRRIERVVKGRSSISFLEAGRKVEDAYEIRGITSAAYYRLLIHELLPDEKKVIYSDVDVLIVGDLTNVFQTDMSRNLIGAVKSVTNYNVHEQRLAEIEYWKREFSDLRDKYINSGFLLMNLEAIRSANLGERWYPMLKRNFHYQDQDILNITCKGRIVFLPPALCKLTYLSDISYVQCIGELFSEQEVHDVINNPVIIHYAGEKPWNYRRVSYADLWWSFLHKFPRLYIWFFGRYMKIVLFRKAQKLFSSI